VVTGIKPTTSGLLDQRRSRSDNQAPSSIQVLSAGHIQCKASSCTLINFTYFTYLLTYFFTYLLYIDLSLDKIFLKY